MHPTSPYAWTPGSMSMPIPNHHQTVQSPVSDPGVGRYYDRMPILHSEPSSMHSDSAFSEAEPERASSPQEETLLSELGKDLQAGFDAYKYYATHRPTRIEPPNR